MLFCLREQRLDASADYRIIWRHDHGIRVPWEPEIPGLRGKLIESFDQRGVFDSKRRRSIGLESSIEHNAEPGGISDLFISQPGLLIGG